jgi:hypothetical protein
MTSLGRREEVDGILGRVGKVEVGSSGAARELLSRRRHDLVGRYILTSRFEIVLTMTENVVFRLG